MALEQRTEQRGGIKEQLGSARDEAKGIQGDFASIAQEVRELLRMEGQLAKAETDEAKAHATKGTMFGGAAAVLGLITAIFLFLTIMFALDELLPLWAAALVTTLIAGALAAIIGFLASREFKAFSPMPKRFMKTMKEDMQWAKSQLRLNAR